MRSLINYYITLEVVIEINFFLQNAKTTRSQRNMLDHIKLEKIVKYAVIQPIWIHELTHNIKYAKYVECAKYKIKDNSRNILEII